MARTLGIDYGEKRIGLALSDDTGTVATPWRTIQVESHPKAAREIIADVERQLVEKIVVGLPMRMDGSSGPAAEKARAFAELLEAAASVPVVFWDERFSTRTAEQALIEGGTRRNRRKQLVDKLAAQIILQHYLDAQAGLPDIPSMSV